MPLTDVGRNHFARALIGVSVNDFDNTFAHLGAGDSATAFNKADTDLQAASNKFRRPMEATYPLVPGGDEIIEFRSLFATGEANFVWAEWGLFNRINTPPGTLLSRKVEALGTKTSAQSWQLTATITIDNP